MRKVTPTLAAKIRDRRAHGETIASISRKYRLSVGTISNVVNAPAPALATPAAAPAPVEASTETGVTVVAEPPTHETLRAWLADQIAALRIDCDKYRRAGNVTALAAATRNLHAAAALLEKITPAPASNDEGVWVPVAEMEAFAAQGEAILMRQAAAMAAEQRTWPVCPACRQHVPPPDAEERIAHALK